MILGSRDPSDFNSDPAPMLGTSTGTRYPTPFSAPQVGESAYYRPRPEFTPTLSHPHNPVLAAFREHVVMSMTGGFDNPVQDVLAEFAGHAPGYFGQEEMREVLALASEADKEHALLVLNRLNSMETLMESL